MAITINFDANNFSDLLLLTKNYGIDAAVDETIIGSSNEQVIPAIYLIKNTIFEVEGFNLQELKRKNHLLDNSIVDTITLNGFSLKIISKKESILFCYELFGTKFLEQYSPESSLFYPFLVIPRENILNYNKIGDVNFLSVKAKKSAQMLLYNKNLSKGNLLQIKLAGKLSDAAFKAYGEFEKDFIEKNGYKFELEFLLDNTPRKIEVVCEEFYIDKFDKFLLNNWTNKDPISSYTEPSKKDNIAGYIVRLIFFSLSIWFAFMMCKMFYTVLFKR